MLKQKISRTVLMVAIVVAAAVLSDYLLNDVVFATPAGFTPFNTALISLVVSAPIGFYLISQRLDLQAVKEALAASVIDKDRAVQESQDRRELAENALARLRESEALYRLLADNQTDVISLWTAEGRRKYASPSIERASGFSIAEATGVTNWASYHPDDVELVAALTRSLAPGGPSKTIEFRALHRNGGHLWVEGTFQKLGDGSGDVLTAVRSIAERKKLGDELVKALEDANAALAVKTEFLANMTHELRTPLNAIIGFSGLLRHSSALVPADARQVELVWDASQTLLRVVNDVLDFSKLEAGAVEFDAGPFDPAWVAESTVSLLASQAAAKGLSLGVAASGPSNLLIGDGGRLRQVLLNFVSNAVKFTAQGGIKVVVSQTSEPGAIRLRMEVRDTGIGVAADQTHAIFGRFTQGDASVSRNYGGTGLGLAISKLIIEAMGGQIGVMSSVGEGSAFWFEVALPAASAIGAAASPAPAPDLDQTLRLLVVDDNAVNRELISALLAPFDLTIETAADGLEAIEAQARGRFDLILMDVQMPCMDGLTATRRIRAATPAGDARVPIIAMTANVLPEQVARCLDAGMDDHVGKPIDPAGLVETLIQWSPDRGRSRQGPGATAPSKRPAAA